MNGYSVKKIKKAGEKSPAFCFEKPAD